MTPPRVLHITNAGGYGRVQAGGAERGVAELASTLASDFGWDETIVAPGEFFEQWTFDRRVRLRPVSLEAFALGGLARPGNEIRTALKEVNPDVVVTHLLRGTLVGLPQAATTVPRASRVSILHNSLHEYSANSANPGRDRANRLAFRFVGRALAHAHVAISDANRRDLIQLDRMRDDRVHRIYNWVSDGFGLAATGAAEVRSTLSVPSDAIVLGFFGRLEQQKRPLLAVRLIANDPRYRLVVVGDGSLRAECEDLARRLEVQDRVHFLGFRRNVADLMRACDVVLIPSEFEGFGRVAAEAISVGTRVVGSDVPGMDEVLKGAPLEGAIAVSGDDLGTWTKAVADGVSRGPAPAEAMKSYVRANYSRHAAASAYDALFRQLLKRSDSPSTAA